jgi:hypothetical protein
MGAADDDGGAFYELPPPFMQGTARGDLTESGGRRPVRRVGFGHGSLRGLLPSDNIARIMQAGAAAGGL